MSACSSPAPRLSEPSDAYLQGLAGSANGGVSPLADRPKDQEAAIQRVIDLFSDFSADNIRPRIRGVYAETLFFRDGFKQFTSVEPLEAYLLRSTEPLRACTFEFDPVTQRGEDFYLPWTMTVSLKRDREGKADRVIGISRIRFDGQGKVIFSAGLLGSHRRPVQPDPGGELADRQGQESAVSRNEGVASRQRMAYRRGP